MRKKSLQPKKAFESPVLVVYGTIAGMTHFKCAKLSNVNENKGGGPDSFPSGTCSGTGAAPQRKKTN